MAKPIGFPFVGWRIFTLIASGLIATLAATAQVQAASETPVRRDPFLTDDYLERLTEHYRQPTAAERPQRILFIGNSITLGHDVPSRVAARAAAEGVEVEVAMAAAGGAHLRDTARISRLGPLLEASEWDVLVLQDHTTTPFRETDREVSADTIAGLAARARTRNVVLYPPWPRAPGHAFYRHEAADNTLQPKGPEEFARRTIEFYESVARQNGYAVAPVPQRWLEAVELREPVYAGDNYHASAEGAELAAQVIWKTLRSIIAPAQAATAP
ncbi:SGNH/GDSL hydrolase family protein [Amaricoccus macauensis]|uniref:SGNH/GDSL hydrolase family protein n=1 Tax=Amaricoccus macauensis TaxID=57001 RepID=UPI003C7A2A66